MISGVHPVRATKIHYYEDPQYLRRVMKPLRPAPTRASSRPDDWSAHAPIRPSAGLMSGRKGRSNDTSGGLRRKPELGAHNEILIKAPVSDHEFDPNLDDSDARSPGENTDPVDAGRCASGQP